MKQNLTISGIGISSILINNVRVILKHCIHEAKRSEGLKQENNSSCFQAIPAYFTAVASVEAFLNEYYLGKRMKMMFKENSVWNLPDEDLEQWDLDKKLRLLPKFLFQKTLNMSGQPYRDMKILIQVRNYLVHYKMYGKVPNSFKDLEQRKIILQDQHANATLGWPMKLSCTEGVRWAHNTACYTIKELLSFDDFLLSREKPLNSIRFLSLSQSPLSSNGMKTINYIKSTLRGF